MVYGAYIGGYKNGRENLHFTFCEFLFFLKDSQVEWEPNGIHPAERVHQDILLKQL